MFQKISFSSFRKNFRASTSVLLLSAFVGACAQPTPDAKRIADKTGDTVGCLSFSDTFFDELYAITLDGKTFPDKSVIDAALDESFANGRLALLPASDKTRLRELVGELYSILAEDVVELAKELNEPVVQTMSALELGDRTTPEKASIQDKIQAKLREINEVTADAKAAGILAACAPNTPPAPGEGSDPGQGGNSSGGNSSGEGSGSVGEPGVIGSAGTLFNTWKATRHPAVYGGLKTLATSYQSCTVGTVPALTTATPNLKGISIVGTHSDGIGSKRAITNLSALTSSHPYLSNYKRPSSSCFDIKSNPLIYDYGGRPATGSLETSKFDMFTNYGSGTKVLGIDCSAYVYMAMATSGLKLKTSGRLKAIGVQGITSYMFKDPANNRLSCLQHATFSPSANLKAGDIVAKAGHVFLVEKVGADPFGIAWIKNSSQCTLANMSISRFDFTILQSSPSKEGIGIHRVQASSFLKETSMAEGLRQHAVNACKAKFGLTTSSRVSTVSIVRHNGSSSCRDTSIGMVNESCVSSCSAQ